MVEPGTLCKPDAPLMHLGAGSGRNLVGRNNGLSPPQVFPENEIFGFKKICMDAVVTQTTGKACASHSPST